MLPGFRFLFAATFLTLSILVFGLGAAALLRAAHEQFATNPSWHAAPEATFVQQVEPAKPLLAMLRVGTPAADQKASGDTPGADAPAIAAPAESTPAERAATVQPPAEPTKIAALKPEPPTLPAEAKSDMPAPESPAPARPAAAAPGDTPASGAPQQVATSTPSDNAQLASTDRAVPEPASPPANEAVPAATDANAAVASPATAAAAPETDIASTKTAALDNPSAAVEMKPPENAASARPDPSVVKKQLRARRAAHRRRMAARAARLARLAAEQLQQQQAADPFGLRFTQPAAAAAVRSRGAFEPAPCPNPKTGARFCATRANQAGPVATGGPSGRPHSDHDPS
jgi:hypothetical protein